MFQKLSVPVNSTPKSVRSGIFPFLRQFYVAGYGLDVLDANDHPPNTTVTTRLSQYVYTYEDMCAVP